MADKKLKDAEAMLKDAKKLAEDELDQVSGGSITDVMYTETVDISESVQQKIKGE